MAVEINLLPKEKAVGKETAKAVSILKKLALGLTVLFLVITIAGGATYFFMNQRLNTLRDEQSTLKSNIQNLQATESSLILLKDRIQKAQNILSSRLAEDLFDQQQTIIAAGSEQISVESSNVAATDALIELSTDNSADLLSLVNNLMVQNSFMNLLLKEMSFNQRGGYSVEFTLN